MFSTFSSNIWSSINWFSFTALKRENAKNHQICSIPSGPKFLLLFLLWKPEEAELFTYTDTELPAWEWRHYSSLPLMLCYSHGVCKMQVTSYFKRYRKVQKGKQKGEQPQRGESALELCSQPERRILMKLSNSK